MNLFEANSGLAIAKNDNLKILGRLFKKEREKHEFSLRGVAQSINIAHTIVSDVENGKIIPNMDTLNQLFNAIDIDLCLDIEFLESMHEHFMSFYQSIYYKEIETSKRLYAQFIRQQERLLYSPLRIEFLIMKATYNGSVTNTLTLEDVKELYNNYDYLMKEQKERFNLIKGTHYFKNGDYTNAKRYLSRNLRLRNFDKAYALTLSYLAQTEACMYQTYKAVTLAKEASALHAKNNNFKRKIDADFTLINNLIDMGHFDEALKLMQSIKYTIKNNGDSQTQDLLDSMNIYIAYRQGNYYQALSLATKIPVETDLQAARVARLYDCVDDKKQAYEVLKPFLKTEKPHLVDYHVVVVFAKMLGHEITEERVDQSIKFLISDLYHFKNIHYLHFVYAIMVEYYESIGAYEEALHIAKKHMQFSKKHITNDTIDE